MKRLVAYLAIAAAICTAAAANVPAGTPPTAGRDGAGWMEYSVSANGDTLYHDVLKSARVFQKLPRKKGRQWRQYYRLVHNFAKTYPYALAARDLVRQVDSTIATDGLKGAKRERFLLKKQKELFSIYEKPLRNLTVSQGALLMRLIDREAGKTSYNIIKEYRNRIAAGFWQAVAKLFDSDLKRPYDPTGEDAPVEELVQIWENGEFDWLYYSIFGKMPPVPDTGVPKSL